MNKSRITSKHFTISNTFKYYQHFCECHENHAVEFQGGVEWCGEGVMVGKSNVKIFNIATLNLNLFFLKINASDVIKFDAWIISATLSVIGAIFNIKIKIWAIAVVKFKIRLIAKIFEFLKTVKCQMRSKNLLQRMTFQNLMWCQLQHNFSYVSLSPTDHTRASF